MRGAPLRREITDRNSIARPIVHRQICAALLAGAMQVFLGSQRREQATLMKNRAVENFGCASDPLDKILAAP